MSPERLAEIRRHVADRFPAWTDARDLLAELEKELAFSNEQRGFLNERASDVTKLRTALRAFHDNWWQPEYRHGGPAHEPKVCLGCLALAETAP